MTNNIIPDYEITDKLYESRYPLIYRGHRLPGGNRLCSRSSNPRRQRKKKAAHFRHEHDILAKINLSGIIKTYRLEEHQGALMMVLEDIDGISLDHLSEQLPLSLPQFLELAAGLADTVEGIQNRFSL